jgi:hypothetical protein
VRAVAEVEAARDLLRAELVEVDPQARPEWHARLFGMLIAHETELRALRQSVTS